MSNINDRIPEDVIVNELTGAVCLPFEDTNEKKLVLACCTMIVGAFAIYSLTHEMQHWIYISALAVPIVIVAAHTRIIEINPKDRTISVLHQWFHRNWKYRRRRIVDDLDSVTIYVRSTPKASMKIHQIVIGRNGSKVTVIRNTVSNGDLPLPEVKEFGQFVASLLAIRFNGYQPQPFWTFRLSVL